MDMVVLSILRFETWVLAVLAVVALVVEVRALLHVLTTRVDAFPAANARTKGFWAVVLGLCTLLGAYQVWVLGSLVALGSWTTFPPLALFGLIAVTVAGVYLADTKRRIEGILANAQTPGRLW